MSEYWDEFEQRVSLWQKEGDVERLHLAELHYEAFLCHETDPDRTLAIYTQGRDEARRLNEPWWVLFYESWRLNALTSHAMDYARALPIAMDLMVLFNSPEGRSHPDRRMVLDNVLYTYISIDPHGFQSEIERGATYLDTLIEQGPVGPRFVFNHRRLCFLAGMGRWNEAYDFGNQSLALVDQSPNQHTRMWHGAWTLHRHCRTCHELGRMEELEDHSDNLREISAKHGQLRRTQADGWLWHAFIQRSKGMEKPASRAFLRGMKFLSGLERRDSICADPMAAYFEACGNWDAALEVRDRELADVTKKGMFHRVCEVHLERCRILKQSGDLNLEHLNHARLAADKLRNPGWYLEKLNQIQTT